MLNIFEKSIIMLVMVAIILVAGLFLYTIFYFLRKKRERFIKTSLKTDGIVEGRNLGAIHPNLYCLEYSYLDANGVEYKNSENLGIAVFKYKKGEKITVYYNPENPKQSVVGIKMRRK